jgi:hypothetical protein
MLIRFTIVPTSIGSINAINELAANHLEIGVQNGPTSARKMVPPGECLTTEGVVVVSVRFCRSSGRQLFEPGCCFCFIDSLNRKLSPFISKISE